MQSIKRFIPASFVVLWATGFIGARYAMPWAEPFTFLAIRFVIAAILFAGLAVLLGSSKATRDEALHATGAGVLMHGIYLGAVFWAIHRGMPAGFSALIVGLQPLITAVLAGKFLGEAILPRHWLGLGIGLVGIVMCAFLALSLVGLVLGFMALRRQDRRRTFGAIGLGLNALILVGTTGLVLVGTFFSHSNS